MGIRGLQTFVEQKLRLLQEFELYNCNVLFDGNSIYHQMYNECHLTCLFGGEYEKLNHHCRRLFQSFQKCGINVIVVFDGARIDDRKLSTTLERSRKRVDYSTKVSVNLDLSPLLLRQIFIDVLNHMNIPYISALGEGDDECVSLANHLDCYLISRDSDYYCYNLVKGYIPFDYVDVNPIEKDSRMYLSAQLFTMDSLLERFPGLQHPTLALACCLCGNDYISGNTVQPIFDHIIETVEKSKGMKGGKDSRTKHWYAMQWMRHCETMEVAFEKLSEPIRKLSTKDQIEKKLRAAVQPYLNPSDTLIYRFGASENENLMKNPYFVQLARDYLDTLDEEHIRKHLDQDLLALKSKFNHPIPAFLLDGLTDLRMSESFIEVLIHRRLICSAHVEIEQEPSIYVDAIPILLPCLAILTKWDNEEDQQSVVIYHRVLRQLKACVYPLTDCENTVDHNQMDSLSLNERQDLVLKCLKTSLSPTNDFHHLHSDYHFWLIILHYWYTIRHLTPVYLYGIIITLVRSVHLFDDDAFQSEDISPLSFSIDDKRNYTQIDPTIRRTIRSKLGNMTKKVYDMKKFDCSIIHEFNCFQTIYMFSMKVNEFFQRPFPCRIAPHKFFCGSFFYAFVNHYETKRNLSDALNDLFQRDAKLLTVIHDLFTIVSTS